MRDEVASQLLSLLINAASINSVNTYRLFTSSFRIAVDGDAVVNWASSWTITHLVRPHSLNRNAANSSSSEVQTLQLVKVESFTNIASHDESRGLSHGDNLSRSNDKSEDVAPLPFEP